MTQKMNSGRPDNNLVWAILSTVFCCLPLGIIAVINSSKVDNLWRVGEYAAAEEAAANSRKYVKWGVICGIISWLLFIIFEFAFIYNLASSNDEEENLKEYVVDPEYGDSIEAATSTYEIIEEDVRNSNRDCPFDVGNGITVTNIKIIGNYILYTLGCDENIVSIDIMNKIKMTTKKDLIESLREDNRDFVELLKEGGIGVIYKYVGNTSGDVCTVKINASEL